LSKDLTNFQQIALRNVIGLVLAILLIKITKTAISVKSVNKKHLIRFGIAFPIAVIFFTYSLVQTKIILGIFAFYVGSILTSLLIGIYVFKEELDANKIVSLVLALIGLILFVAPVGLNLISRGIIYGVIGGFFDAVANSYRKYLSGKLDRLLLTTIPLIGGLIIALILMSVSNQEILPLVSLNGWIVGMIFGSLLFLVNYLSFIGFSNFELNLGTLVVSSELFFAPLFALLVFGEKPLFNELMGGLMIIFSIITSNINLLNSRLVKKV